VTSLSCYGGEGIPLPLGARGPQKGGRLHRGRLRKPERDRSGRPLFPGDPVHRLPRHAGEGPVAPSWAGKKRGGVPAMP
jgi:hypothetical protein